MRLFIKHLPRFCKAEREMEMLASREQWSRATIESFQLQRLNDVWQHAYQYVPYYQELREYHNLPSRFSDLEEFKARMPVLKKAQVREQPSAFLSKRSKPGRWHHTSGSTGIPLRVFRSHDAHHETLRTKYRFYEMWGHSTFDPMVWLWSIDGPGSGWAGKIEGVRRKTMDWARNRLRLTVSNLDSQQLRNHLARIAAYRPTAIYGFSHAVHLLAREALDVGFSCDSLKLINLSGEAATERMVTNIERAFGVPAVMEYGCIEFGMIAGELPDRKMRVREDIALVETLKRKDDRYDLVLTALNNPSFPILRYDIGDTTNGPIIHQSNGFSILPKVSGRDDDLIVSQSGRILSPTDIDQLFEYDHCKVVRRYRVHQHADGALAVTLELSDSGRESDVVKLRQQLESLVEGYRVDLQIADSIEQTAAGKHRVITSELAKED